MRDARDLDGGGRGRRGKKAMSRPAADDDDDGSEGDVGRRPGEVDHWCTDPFWIFLLCAALFYEGQLSAWAISNNKVGVLLQYHADRRAGKAHTVEKEYPCEGNNSKGHAFYCLDRRYHSEYSLQLHHPVCVDKCPTSNATRNMCYDKDLRQNQSVMDYSTEIYTVANYSFCLPNRTEYLDLYIQAEWHIYSQRVLEFLAKLVTEISDAWWVITISVCMSFVSSYVYLLVVQQVGEKIVWLCMLVTIAGPCYFGYKMVGPIVLEGEKHDDKFSSGDQEEDLVLGGVLMCSGAVILALFMLHFKSLRVASGCITAAAECVYAVPLILEPLISLAIKTFLPIQLVVFSVLFLSTGIRKTEGNALTLDFSDQAYGLEVLMYFVCLLLWAADFSNALSTYVIAYATQMWYFTPYDRKFEQKQDLPSCAICLAYTNAVHCHLGSLAFGSLLTCTFRWPKAVLGILADLPRENPVVSACDCCIGFYRDYLEWIGPAAYMDMCLSSSAYIRAGVRSAKVLAKQKKAVRSLDNAQFLFSLAGMSLVIALSFALTYFMCEKLKPLSNLELRWQPACVVVTLLSAIICGHFMIVFDAVGDALLYCFFIDDKDEDEFTWGGLLFGVEDDRPKHTPVMLRRLMDDFNFAPESSESDE